MTGHIVTVLLIVTSYLDVDVRFDGNVLVELDDPGVLAAQRIVGWSVSQAVGHTIGVGTGLRMRPAHPGRNEESRPDGHDGEVQDRATHRPTPAGDTAARHLVTSRTVNALVGIDEDVARCVAK